MADVQHGARAGPQPTPQSVGEAVALQEENEREIVVPIPEDLGKDGGAVVNVASVEAHQPAIGHGHYAVSKAGLIMLTRAAALEYGPDGIRVNSVSPGLIDDGTLAERWPDGVERWLAAAPLRRIGTPGDVADAVTFLVSPMARWVTGADLVVDGGILAVPTW